LNDQEGDGSIILGYMRRVSVLRNLTGVNSFRTVFLERVGITGVESSVSIGMLAAVT
jgi:hypothetical protein